jgi:hypothetical protein
MQNKNLRGEHDERKRNPIKYLYVIDEVAHPMDTLRSAHAAVAAKPLAGVIAIRDASAVARLCAAMRSRVADGSGQG